MPDPAEPPRYRSVFRPGLFEGQVCWVTGGGSGIGRCVAHELAALGAQRGGQRAHAAKLQAVAAEITADGGQCLTRGLRHPRRRRGQGRVAEVVARHGPVHGLVNNAGGQFPSPWRRSARRASTRWWPTT
jgi:citronellol/citronellal dehydrogenase